VQALALAHKLALRAKVDSVDRSPLKILERHFASPQAVNLCPALYKKQGLLI
jgi:hypothetical protein